MKRLACPISRAILCPMRRTAAVLLALCVAMGGETRAVAAIRDELPPHLVRLAQNLQAQIDRTYRLNHHARDRRTAQVKRALRSWHASARQVRDDEILDAWFRDALSRSAPARRLHLPPVPTFVHRSTRPPDAGEPLAGPRPGARPNQQTRQPPLPIVVLPPLLVNSRFEITDPELRTFPRPPHPDGMPRNATSNGPPPRRSVLAIAPDAKPMISPIPLQAKPLQAGAPQAGAMQPIPMLDSPVLASPAPLIPTQPAPAEPVAERPIVVSPLPSAETPVTTPAAPTGQPLVGAPVAKINLAEYRARAAGYRRGLRRVEAELVSGEAPTSRELMKLAQELTTLADQRKMLEVYSKLLGSGSPREGAQLLPSPDLARKLLKKAANTRRDALRQPGILRTWRERELELSILSAIEQHLAQK